jgi:hypothetical protein
LDFLNRDQISKIHRLGKVRNTNRVLNGLSDYISNFREGYSNIYYLNKLGRMYVNCDKVRKKNANVNHTIMRNQFYIFIGLPTHWKNESKVKDDKISLICDAIFQKEGKLNLLEIDHKQKSIENRQKIKLYKELKHNKIIETNIGYFPRLYWVTTTEYRRKQLQELCKELPCTVYTMDDIR